MSNAVPGVKGFVAVDLEQRFWAKVDRGEPDECWEWQGNRDLNGYGRIWVDGRSPRASRVAWELENGCAFPAGMLACHTCDNPPCVNPRHIFVGTYRDNQRDASAKKRNDPRGRAHWTHCKRGHEYTPENTLIQKDGSRSCRACQAIRNAKRSWGPEEAAKQRERRRRRREALATNQKEVGDGS